MKFLEYILKKLKIRPQKKIEVPFFTNDIFESKKYLIGQYTYGRPNIFSENDETNLIIGKYCSIAKGVNIFLGGNHRTDWITTYPFNVLKNIFPEASEIIGHPATKGNVIIGNDVWIGRNATILSGIKIGDGAVIAANSVLTKNVGDYEIWGGNPAKLIKKRFNDELIKELKELKWWDLDENLVRKLIPFLCSDNLESIKKELNLYK